MSSPAAGFAVGDLTILPVLDGTTNIKPAEFFRMGGGRGRGLTEEDWAQHADLLNTDGEWEVPFGGYLLLAPGDRTILVDAGFGPQEFGPFRGGDFIRSLETLGYTPDAITDVVFTHLHPDHTGWATTDGQRTFDNAVYRCNQLDWDCFMGPDAPDVVKQFPAAYAALRAVEDRMETWTGDVTLAPGVDLVHAPGHTPGSTLLALSSGTDRAMLIGDVAHCPVELLDEEWAGLGDIDPALAARTRSEVARRLETTGDPAAGAHFQGLKFGRLLTDEGTRRWEPSA